MANTQAAFGFQQVGTASGAPNFARAGSPTAYKIKSTYTTAIFFGDLVRMWVSGDAQGGAAGYLTQWVAGDGATSTKIPVGIFIGCEYYSTSQKKGVWNNYYPGSDATGDVSCYIIDDPNAQFLAQAGASAIDYTKIGFTTDVVVGSGNTTTGISGMYLGTPGATSTYPFKIVNILTSPPGVNGTDNTTGYNNVMVAFNNQQYKNSAGV